MDILRKFPFTSVLVVLIWVACLVPIPETPLGEVRLIDKWTHIVMYAMLALTVWFEYRKQQPSSANGWSLLCILAGTWAMGGLIEIVQATCTHGIRSGEWMDFAADGVGSLMGIGLAYLMNKRSQL